MVDIMVDVFPKYTYTKSGTYYFSKTVPRDLKPHYTRNRIIICLKTKSAKKAELSSKSLLSKLEKLLAWSAVNSYCCTLDIFISGVTPDTTEPQCEVLQIY